MSHHYFSEKELGARERTSDAISLEVWHGLVRVMQTSIERGDFGEEFPDQCQDGIGIIGTSMKQMGRALKAEVPDAQWPLAEDTVPEIYVILDLIEFCHRHIAEPRKDTYHDYFRHHHLSFMKVPGQRAFRDQVNLIFRRNCVTFELGNDGAIIRLVPPVLRNVLGTTIFKTGDATLDQMIEQARHKFISPDSKIRRESLERLWDAWERVKTIHDQDKKKSMSLLLNIAANEGKFRTKLDVEAKELTNIGNEFLIRHSETTQTPLERDEHVDYLFHRLFALIYMLLSIDGKTQRMQDKVLG